MKRFRNPLSAPLLESRRREPYLLVFLLGFAIILLIMAPVMIMTGGYFVYYGDFNSQQIPFYHLAHQAVTNGEFGWNWRTDLGANFIGSYSFYLLGSPFFWLTALFPEKCVLYLMPYLLAMKHGFAAMTAYAYLRRFVRGRVPAMIGGLLYAYSGFQLFNIFFNHFQDVTAFFPLMLIAMEQRVNENRRGVFALVVGFMAVLNYYFFTGQAVFLVLYFIVRCGSEDFRANLRKLLSLALEAVLGGLMAAFMLLPSALAILGNDRVGTFLFGLDMVSYYDRTRLLHIVQSFFMLPDVPARPNLFQTDYGKWASIGGYLPLYSMAGVLAFMKQKRSHWATRLTVICIVCAFVPILNTMFYTFNSSYYARWYYMPILIMALMTAYALDNPQIRWRSGVTVCGIFLAAFAVLSFFPVKEENTVKWFKFAKFPWFHWLSVAACAVMLYLLCMLLVSRKRGWHYQGHALGLTVLSCVVCTGMTVYFGIGMGMYPEYYVGYAIRGGREISLPEAENQFYRIDISEDYDNYPMLWGNYPNMRCFQSIVPVSVMDFYDAVDVQRDVASRADKKNYPLRALFNVKYYFDKADSENTDAEHKLDMPGFKYLKKENGFYIYENEAYIPMGVAYDSYIDTESLNKLTALGKERTMLQALGLDQEQIAKYGDILTELAESDRYGQDEEAYLQLCSEIAANRTCKTFTYDSYGFEAEITLEKPALVFFSVPYESGWSATVNGGSMDVERVSYGFMAVRCEAGDNQIAFHYETPGLKTGILISLCAFGALLLYLLIMWIACRKQRESVPRTKYCYDYSRGDLLPLHSVYARYTYLKTAGHVLGDDGDDTPPPVPEDGGTTDDTEEEKE